MENIEITKTVYSICLPYTKSILKNKIFNKFDDIQPMFENAWTKKQDPMHTPFFNKFVQFIQPKVFSSTPILELFPFQYPTSGSSEAIRETIAYLQSKNKRLVVFHGEYEGYEAIAASLGMNVLKIHRDTWQNHISELTNNDIFFISHPSSIDGNNMIDYDEFMSMTEKFNIPVYLDICYIGISKNLTPINLNYHNLHGIFFSLSKIFGVYYHRIGGCLMKEENPLLYGNMWFKNLLALKYGEELLKNTSLQSISDFLLFYQNQAFNILKTKKEFQMLTIEKSDVLLLVNMKVTDITLFLQHPFFKSYIRTEHNNNIRFCLSPIMEKLINKSNNETY